MDILEIFEKFGLPIAFLVIMIWFYITADKRHFQERKEWREDRTELHKDTNNVIRELTKAIQDSNKHIK